MNSLGVVTGLQAVANRSTTALPLFLVLVHAVLKCAHHFVLKYVMLRQPAVSSHDFLHCSRLEAITDDAFRGTSPAPWLHLTFGVAGPHPPHLGVVVGGTVVVSGASDAVCHRKQVRCVCTCTTCQHLNVLTRKQAKICGKVYSDPVCSYLNLQPLRPPPR